MITYLALYLEPDLNSPNTAGILFSATYNLRLGNLWGLCSGVCEVMCGVCEVLYGVCEVMCGVCEGVCGVCELMCVFVR